MKYYVIYYENENSVGVSGTAGCFDSKEEAEGYLAEIVNDYPERIWEVRQG